MARSAAEREADLARLQDIFDRGDRPTVRQMAREVGRSRPTVERDLAELDRRSVHVAAAHGTALARGVERAGRLALSSGPDGKTRATVVAGRRARGGRVSLDQAGTLSVLNTIAPPDDHYASWKIVEFDRAVLNEASPSRLTELLANLSPPLSRAIWDLLRFLDPGHEVTAYKIGSSEPDENAQAFVDAFLGRLRERHGSVKVLTSRLFMGAYLRGAFFAELVLDRAGRQGLDIATPDPMSVRFREVDDPELGKRWQLGQWQKRRFVPLEGPTIKYLPVDPWPGRPYGRAPATPALFPALFLLGLFSDLRRVVAQQGWTRIDIEIDLEAVAAAYPTEYEEGGDRWEAVIDRTVLDVVEGVRGQQPDEAYVHTSEQHVNVVPGATSGGMGSTVDSLIKALERSAVQALKTMPLTMGITDGVSEANANRQWEIQAAGVKSLQHLAESLLGDLVTLELEANGVLADVEWRFHELRAAELERDEKTRRQQMENAAFAEDRGWVTPLAAADYGMDGDLDDEVIDALDGLPPGVAPPAPDSDQPDETDDDVPEPGSNRAGKKRPNTRPKRRPKRRDRPTLRLAVMARDTPDGPEWVRIGPEAILRIARELRDGVETGRSADAGVRSAADGGTDAGGRRDDRAVGRPERGARRLGPGAGGAGGTGDAVPEPDAGGAAGAAARGGDPGGGVARADGEDPGADGGDPDSGGGRGGAGAGRPGDGGEPGGAKRRRRAVDAGGAAGGGDQAGEPGAAAEDRSGPEPGEAEE